MNYVQLMKKDEGPNNIKPDMVQQLFDNFDINRSYNIRISKRNLKTKEIHELANRKFKRTDGQFIYDGELISMGWLHKILYEEYCVLTIECVPIDDIYQNYTIPTSICGEYEVTEENK